MRRTPSAAHAALARGFTLLELLVVIAIIGVLIALISPAIEKGVERSRLAVCGENLHAISTGIHMYASEFNDALPVGPATPSTLDPARSMNHLGDSLAWRGATSQYNGLGILTKGWCNNPKSLLCPFNDDKSFDSTFTRNLGTPGADAYTSYLYRQLDQTTGDRLTTLGNNGVNLGVKALAMDWQSEAAAPYRHTSHDYNEFVNILFADGHIQSFPNHKEDFVIRDEDVTTMPAGYVRRIDNLWVKADYSESGEPSAAPALP